MTEPNPFDEFGLEATASVHAITERLRELAERAAPHDREAIKALWRRLTLDADERVRLALRAHPRASDALDQPIDSLAAKLRRPPGELDAPVIQATIADVLLDADSPDEPPFAPPDAFGRISALAPSP